MEDNIDPCKKCIRDNSVVCLGCVHYKKDYYRQEWLNDRRSEKRTDKFTGKDRDDTRKNT
jgi:hypothetical protein